MSRVLRNAMVGRAFAQIGVKNESLLADLPAMVELGLQRIYGFQHNDGGWGWWYDDNSNEYQTAYVLFSLAATRDAGPREVDPEDCVMYNSLRSRPGFSGGMLLADFSVLKAHRA